ncbi:MAG: ABC-F family ATP-binding cassette domain-containing protein [Oscillospiraceae bacterium]|nr:ABC-F family ATP-binding cassette domain-containing protein [Oscillospiraceae bacterium]
MILLSAEKISKSYSEKKLISDVSLYLNKNDKVGIIGINGAGKSTLLNILAGKEMSDEGKISKYSAAKISYLEQNPAFDINLSLIEIVFKDLDEETKQAKEYEAKTILTKLGFTNFDINANNLSGGEKKRVAIARALVNPCEILILDEPTNHLDSQMILWLENYLKSYNGAIVMVTHDRYFLDRVVNRIVEIDDGTLYSYDGGYSRYLELKMQRAEMESATRRKDRSLFKKELEWMQRGARARGTKSKSRIARFETLSDGNTSVTEKLEMDSVSTRLGKKTIEIKDVSKSFDGHCLIKNFSHIIMKDARIGIIGKNGSGKTTLMKIITGTLELDSGEIVYGDTVKIGYVLQEWETPPEQMKVIDYIKEAGEQVVTNDGIISASKMLEKFLFPSYLQWNTINKLSGGEKRRLYLLKTLMEAPNILFLDEPTNDLDTLTLTVLENYLESFSGAVVAISHDRYFLDKVVNTIFELDGDGIIKQYNGGYSDYLEKRESLPADKMPVKLSIEPQKIKPVRTQKPKFTFNEQREYDTIENDIADLEQQLNFTKDEIEKHSSDYGKLVQFLDEKEKIEAELSLKMDRWVYLNNLAEKITKL